MKTEETANLWRQLFRVADTMREIGSRDFEQQLSNLTFNQLRMIKVVYLLNRDFPEGVTLKVLAESLSITPAAASEMVDALVRKGMLQRDHNPQDRRAVAITLSDDTAAGFKRCEDKFDRIGAGFLATLSKEEAEAFSRTLAKLKEWVDQQPLS